MYKLGFKFNLEASHYSTFETSLGARRDRLHGHSYVVSVVFSAGAIDDEGKIADIDGFDGISTHIKSKLDHVVLNEVDGLKWPTMEAMCKFIFDEIKSLGVTPNAVEIERPTLNVMARYSAE